MQDVRQNVFYIAAFMVVVVMMAGVWMLPEPRPSASVFGPEALPFECAMIRRDGEAGDLARDFVLALRGGETGASTGDGTYPICGALVRGTSTESGQVCLRYITYLPDDLWQDQDGGELHIGQSGAAIYIRQERLTRNETVAPIAYTGTCKRVS